MLRFRHTCVGCSGEDLDDLLEIIDNNRQITRLTFVANVDPEDRKELESNLGYDRSFPMKNDWHVSYHKSRCKRHPVVYYVRWSGIEHLFY